MRTLVTGATGFIGRQLVERLDDVVVLTRQPDRVRASFDGARVIGWDPLSGPPPSEALDGVEVVFNLAGEPIAEGRWTAAKKRRLVESRVLGTKNLVAGLKAVRPPLSVLVSASAVGFYGSRGDQLLDETATPTRDFLAQLCVDWEVASAPARELGARVVNPRIGIVLGHGGALKQMLTPFKLGVGGRLGSGEQWMPWIHIADMVGLLLHAASCDSLNGPMNAVAPNPVTNREFTQRLAAAVHRPAFFPAPELGLRLMLGEFAGVLLASQRVVPNVAFKTGYAFQFPLLADALAQVLDAPQRQPAAV